MINCTLGDCSRALFKDIMANVDDRWTPASKEPSYRRLPHDYFTNAEFYQRGFSEITLGLKNSVAKCKTVEAVTDLLQNKMSSDFKDEKCLDDLYYDIAYDQKMGDFTGILIGIYNTLQE